MGPTRPCRTKRVSLALSFGGGGTVLRLVIQFFISSAGQTPLDLASVDDVKSLLLDAMLHASSSVTVITKNAMDLSPCAMPPPTIAQQQQHPRAACSSSTVVGPRIEGQGEENHHNHNNNQPPSTTTTIQLGSTAVPLLQSMVYPQLLTPTNTTTGSNPAVTGGSTPSSPLRCLNSATAVVSSSSLSSVANSNNSSVTACKLSMVDLLNYLGLYEVYGALFDREEVGSLEFFIFDE